MKRILLTILLVLGLASPSWALTRIIHLPLTDDLLDTQAELAAGECKRVSGATRINAGTMEVMRGNRTNLVQRSHDFDQWWTKSNITLTDGTSDPDGGSNADLMAADATAFNNPSDAGLL